jgi:hypothetical protein
MGLGFRVQGLVQGSGFENPKPEGRQQQKDADLGFGVWGLGFRASVEDKVGGNDDEQCKEVGLVLCSR